MNRLPLVLTAAAITLVGCSSASPSPVNYSTPTPVASSVTPSPTDPVRAEAISVCESLVTSRSHLDPDILTFTKEVAVQYEKRSWSVGGYVNNVEFSCYGIKMGFDGYWDTDKVADASVTIGGVDTDPTG